MNLTDYPTPQCDGIRFQAQPGMMPPFDTVPYTVAARIEREAAAWRAVAELALLRLCRAVMEDGKAMSMRSQSPASSLKEVQSAFDALKSQLTQP